MGERITAIGEPMGLEARVELVDGAPRILLEWPAASHEHVGGLSLSEADVLALALSGLSSQAIADRRRRSRRTVENQLAGVFAKLGVRCRLELFARFAAPLGSGGQA